MTLKLRESDLEWRQIDDEIVALDARDGNYLAVAGSGAILWRLLAQATTNERLVQALVGAYDVDSARATADVDAFVRSLDERGLLAA